MTFKLIRAYKRWLRNKTNQRALTDMSWQSIYYSKDQRTSFPRKDYYLSIELCVRLIITIHSVELF